MRISITQVRQRIAALGFEMNPLGADCKNYGRMDAEPYTDSTYHILSKPFRSVFIAKCINGWYITSHIHFNARKFRARLDNTGWVERKNIFGHGVTLKDAVRDFEINYYLKIHGQR